MGLNPTDPISSRTRSNKRAADKEDDDEAPPAHHKKVGYSSLDCSDPTATHSLIEETFHDTKYRRRRLKRRGFRKTHSLVQGQSLTGINDNI